MLITLTEKERELMQQASAIALRELRRYPADKANFSIAWICATTILEQFVLSESHMRKFVSMQGGPSEQ